MGLTVEGPRLGSGYRKRPERCASRPAYNSPGGNHALSVPLSTVFPWIMRGLETYGKRGAG